MLSQRIVSLAFLALLATGSPVLANPRCDGFPPRNHLFDVKGDVVGWVAGPCTGQLFPVLSSANTDANAATVQSLTVERRPRFGTFRMTGLRDFVYAPSQGIIGKGWDEVTLRLTYTLPNGKPVTKPVVLRLTTESEYNRMRAAGQLN